MISILIFICLAINGNCQVSEHQMPDITQTKPGGIYYYQTLGAHTINPNLTLSIPQFLPQGNNFWQLKYDVFNVKSRIGLKIITEENQADFNFRYSLPVEITVFKEDHTSSSFTTTVEVNYDHTVGSSFKQIDIAEYPDGYKLIVEPDHSGLEITSYDPVDPSNITSLSPTEMEIASQAVMLKASIVYEKIEFYNPEYRHDGNNIDVSLDQATNNIEICWDPIYGAKQYDLEWTTVERIFNGWGWPRADFNTNAARVLLKDNCYEIPNVFGRVGLLFRVRAKGYTIDNYDNLFIGLWSCSYPTNNCDDYSDVRAFYWSSKLDLASHEQDSLNWQAVTSYAEDGKRKDVVTYMDGTMRSRQTVTAINSNENVLVAETIYDHQGRPAIQSLPAPVHQDMRLKFRQNFNQNTAGAAYSKSDFDLDNGCDLSVGMMSDNSGSAHYYSPSFYNSLDPQEIDKNPHHTYIPKSEGYPFVQTEYTADNTGRIARQGGAGPQYQLDSSHETKYFYGVPSQEELDILFGTNVGLADHYKKNMVVDPNGQVSVSYLDAKGNTIATALAGEAPEGLEQLDSYDPVVLNVDLLKLQRKVKVNNELSSVYNLLVADDALYAFDYSITAAQFTDDCMSGNVCYGCYYDLEISIVNNQCGTEEFRDTISITEFSERDSINFICSQTGIGYQVDTTLMLDIGSYSVIKTLKVNESIADAYVEHYLNDAQNNCTNKLEEFLLEELALVDTAYCGIICEDLNDNPQTPEEIAAQEGWEEMLCDTMPSSPCEVARNLMLADFMPGGQYAGYGQNYSVSDYPLSILNVSNDFENGLDQIDYTFVDITYSPDEYATINGEQVDPATLTVQQYIKNYNEAWAEHFLIYHPEYCYLQRCWDIEASHNFDIEINIVETYDVAATNGWIDFNDHMLLYDADSFTMAPIVNISTPNLPPGMSTATFYTAFKNAISDYSGLGANILQIAITSTLCPGADNPQQYLDDPSLLSGIPPPSFNASDQYFDCLSTVNMTENNLQSLLTDDQKDEIWTSYKALYLSLKNNFEYIVRTVHAKEGGCYNECIGQENFNPFINNFSSIGIGSDVDGNDIPELGYFDDQMQVCDTSYFLLYQDKQKRFPSAYDIMPNMDVDVYDPETATVDIWQNILENLEEEVLQSCKECDKITFIDTFFNALFSEINIDANPNDAYAHNEFILNIDLPNDFSQTVSIHFWNPTNMNHLSGFRIVFADNCELTFTYPFFTPHDITLCGNSIYPTEPITIDELSINNQSTDAALIQMESPILPNNGTYVLNVNFDAISGNGISKLEVIGVYNPINAALNSSNYQNSNLDYFGISNSVVLGDITLNEDSSFTNQRKDFSFYTNDLSINSNGLTHILLVPSRTNNFGNKIVEINSIYYCKYSDNKLPVFGHPEIISNVSYNPNDQTLILEGISDTNENFTITAETSCDFSCEEGGDSLSASCHTLPEARDFQNFLNAFNWRNTASPGQVNQQTNINNIGSDLQSVIGIDTEIGQYQFTTNISLDSVIVSFNEECSVILNFGRASSQFGGNDIYQFGHIEADFTQVGADGFTDHFTIDYQNKDGQWTTASGYTNGCFHVGYCCPDQVDSGSGTTPKPGGPPKPPIGEVGPQPWPPKPPSGDGDPQPWPDIKPTPIKKAKNTLQKIGIKELKTKKSKEPSSTAIDPVYYSGAILNTPQLSNPYNDSIYQQRYCPPCRFEIEGGLFADTNNEPCIDVWCQDSIAVIYATDLNGDCIDQLYAVAEANTYNRYDQYIDSVKMDVKARYLAQCLNAQETFTGEFAYAQHHFTLYYYDQANNLVQTVPPNGIDTLKANVDADMLLMNDYREQQQLYKEGISTTEPTSPDVSRTLTSWASEYTYNSQNQLTEQEIPDQGFDYGSGFEKEPTVFWYDDLGRLVASQNPEQATAKKYSYTLYDGLGRIRETGEIEGADDPDGGDGLPIETGYYQDGQVLDAEGSWFNFLANTRSQITETTYDNAYHGDNPPLSFPPSLTMDNLRGRVAAAAYYEQYNDLMSKAPDYISHYSYDIHGNVKSLVQKPKGFASKTIEYDYDLISGNVNYVWYQRDKKDQFTHSYNYDADNQLTLVQTSRDGVIWEEDAHYKYYLHGPLARIELGEDEVQGLDYAYTLQGWIKGMNSASSRPEHDIGQDGKADHRHENFARDEVGFTLNYNQQDYSPAGASAHRFDSDWNTNSMSPELWNGNIRSMITSIRSFMSDGKPAAYSYTYDQLNRIKSMNHHKNFEPQSNSWINDQTSNNYSSSYSYDANGNILNLHRSAMDGIAAKDMDEFTYQYTNGNNRLRHVTDPVNANNFNNDIDNQNSDNYTYDRLGNLTKDEAEDIINISWNLSGKVNEIEKSDGTNIKFRYDALGNRIAKAINDTITWYVRDASGNMMSTYESKAANNGLNNSVEYIKWQSANLYGSSRLGQYQLNEIIGGSLYSVPQNSLSTIQREHYSFFRGQDQYELSNHLGNVLTTVSDRKRFELDANGESEYVVDVMSASDYYPGGMLMASKSSSLTDYYYKHQGQESDSEVNGKGNSYFYKYRMSDARLNRFFSVDPLRKKFPYYSSFQFSGNKLIDHIEFEGLEEKSFYSLRLEEALAKKDDAGDIAYYSLRRLEEMFGPTTGVEGAENVAGKYNTMGVSLGYIKHPIAQVVSKYYGVLSDFMSTGIDFEENHPQKYERLAARIGMIGVGESFGYVFDKMNTPEIFGLDPVGGISGQMVDVTKDLMLEVYLNKAPETTLKGKESIVTNKGKLNSSETSLEEDLVVYEYEIVKGDNISKIAKEFDTTVESIMHRNKIKDRDQIIPGQKIIVTESMLIN